MAGNQQGSTMKQFLFAAIAALSLGVGSAYAAQAVQHNGLSVAPAYSDDAPGGA
jgi:hypothetical protein